MRDLRAVLILEFDQAGEVEAFQRGDLRFLRRALRNLAGALLTDPEVLDHIAGASGIPYSTAGFPDLLEAQ